MDGTSAYGILVQAKRVTVMGNKWVFGFDAPVGSGPLKQRDVLRSAAKALDLLPVYALYLGTADYRG